MNQISNSLDIEEVFSPLVIKYLEEHTSIPDYGRIEISIQGRKIDTIAVRRTIKPMDIKSAGKKESSK